MLIKRAFLLLGQGSGKVTVFPVTFWSRRFTGIKIPVQRNTIV